jgi:hypothetical protein
VKRFKGKDGTFTTHVYDSNTGRLIEATTVADPAATKSADGAEQPKGANKYAAATEASPQPRGASIGLDHGLSSAAATGAESAGLDLVKLATAYADALGAVEEAEVKAAAGGPENNLAAAKAALRSAQRKQELLRNLASVAADAARADLTRAQQLVRSGYATAESTTVAESRLKMLSAILQSGSSNVDPKQAAPSLKAD